MLNKVTPRLHRFAAARFSPEGEFGLHLTVGVAMLLAAMAVFARLAGAVVAGAPITQTDLEVANWLHEHARQGGLLRELLLVVTHVHSTPGMLALTAIAGIWLYRRGHRYWIVALIASVPGGMLLNVALKHTFERARPHFVEPILTLSTYSFPSGHALAATVFYGFLACYAARHARGWPGRVLPFLLAAAMIFTVAFSRMYLGAHYLSDVLAGMLEGCGWLAVCITAAVTFNRRSAARQKRQTGSAPPQEV
ncbi:MULTISPECIES: phosphatase PAP2 family protein [unclassified Massilia]|uniref:phosphatase PAP2 family protein n=1 Tax=unclassified Massilia TaxID=2609279 RepID=UPI001B83B487|nr:MULTISPECIES: phosphatase PAP2 family protein [unclassified Massilia]MBQ5941684.1 phosphatase PAP2 family protein [Massilia sp. AB1]MBQ5962905.1 phosphatase PAP2 family protein [Massilia sp. ZL223]